MGHRQAGQLRLVINDFEVQPLGKLTEQVFDGWNRAPAQEILQPVLAHQAVRVFALRQEHEFEPPPLGQGRQGVLQRPPSGPAPGLVSVEAADHFLRVAVQLAELAFAGGRAQGRHRIRRPALRQRHCVHVAFHDQDAGQAAGRLAGLVQPVQFFTLAEDRSFRGIEVLRPLPVAEPPAAEADDPAPGVADGEHDAGAEPVVHAALILLADKARIQQLLRRDRAGPRAEGLVQAIPGIRGEADLEALGNFLGQAPGFQILGGRLGLPQLGKEVALGALQCLVQGSIIPLRPGGSLARHLDPGSGSQSLHRLDEGLMFVLHEESDRRAVGAAAEAVVELLVLADGEGRGFFLVEGAARLMVLAGLLERHPLADQGDDIGPAEQIVDEGLGYPASHWQESAPELSQPRFHLGADRAHVRPALHFLPEPAHHLAHVPHAGGAQVGDGGVDEGVYIRLAQGFRQEGGDELQLEPLLAGQIVPAGLDIVGEAVVALLRHAGERGDDILVFQAAPLIDLHPFELRADQAQGRHPRLVPGLHGRLGGLLDAQLELAHRWLIGE